MDTIGHNAVKQRFAKTLQRGRLASTFLFVGPAGVGKRTFAEDLVRVLLCQSPDAAKSLQACGGCESCQLLAAGGHPDRLLVEKPAGKSSLPIELFVGRADHRNREGLCHDIAMRPYLSSRRVAIIDDADRLGVESANALLKTLEEPPPRSVLILIGTSLSKQLPTIRSRSQVVRFGPLSDDELHEVLLKSGAIESEHERKQAVAVAAGSVAAALAVGDGQLSAFREQVTRTLGARNFDPIRFGTEVIELSQSGAAEPAARRERLRTIIGYAIDHYRETLRDQTLATGAPKSALLHQLDCSLAAAEAIDRNANQATVVQHWLTNLAAP